MIARPRWGWDRRAGARRRPAPLIRPIKFPPRVLTWADKDSRHEASAPAGASACAGDQALVRANVDECPSGAPAGPSAGAPGPMSVQLPSAPTRVAAAPAPGRVAPAARIALPTSSAMDDMACARVILGPVLAQIEDGKTWCARCEWRVPAWFGRDCIEGPLCSLKGHAA